MGGIPSGSSTEINPRSTAVAPAVAFVRVRRALCRWASLMASRNVLGREKVGVQGL